MNPFIFVFGCPRSGTTVVHRILDFNPALCMLPGEQKWITRYFEKTEGEKINDEMSFDVFSHLMKEDPPVWMRRCESEIRQILADGGTFRNFIIRLFAIYCKT